MMIKIKISQEIIKFTINDDVTVDIYVERVKFESGAIIYNYDIPKTNDSYYEEAANSTPIDGNITTEVPLINSDEKITNQIINGPFFGINSLSIIFTL